MGAVGFGAFFPLRRGRHGSVFGSAVSAGIGQLVSPIIDALSRWRGRLGETRWFELFFMMIPPLGLFAVLAGSSTDAVTTSFLIFFVIYSNLVIALLWFTEKDDAPAEPPSLIHAPSGSLLREGSRGSSPQFPQLDTRETHSRRGRPRASAGRGHD
jgi:hypothetical protein